MNPVFSFIINSILLGVGLSMDAFSVSLANGLGAPKMSQRMRLSIPLTFAAFQFLMPMIGWILVRSVAENFVLFQQAIPWIALVLLLFIGAKMLIEGLRGSGNDEKTIILKPASLLLQGIATSIDALSVGFTIADYTPVMAVSSALIIAVVTFIICLAGLKLGRHFGTRLSGKATILGGCILIFIGIRILLDFFRAG